MTAKSITCPHCNGSAVYQLDDIYDEMDDNEGKVTCVKCMKLIDPHARRVEDEPEPLMTREEGGEGDMEITR